MSFFGPTTITNISAAAITTTTVTNFLLKGSWSSFA
jgi:hypothetical protein